MYSYPVSENVWNEKRIHYPSKHGCTKKFCIFLFSKLSNPKNWHLQLYRSLYDGVPQKMIHFIQCNEGVASVVDPPCVLRRSSHVLYLLPLLTMTAAGGFLQMGDR